jgi:nitrate/nitrite transporter NarK
MWFFASICNVLVGWVSSKYGNDWVIIIVGSIMMVFAHLVYLLMPDCNKCWQSVVPLMILGFCYSTYSILLFSNLPKIVDSSLLGTAYGIGGVFLNLISVIVPPLIGDIKDNTQKNHGYFWTEVSFIFFAALAFFINVYIYLSIRKTKL